VGIFTGGVKMSEDKISPEDSRKRLYKLKELEEAVKEMKNA